jgi:hypothetical protein
MKSIGEITNTFYRRAALIALAASLPLVLLSGVMIEIMGRGYVVLRDLAKEARYVISEVSRDLRDAW